MGVLQCCERQSSRHGDCTRIRVLLAAAQAILAEAGEAMLTPSPRRADLAALIAFLTMVVGAIPAQATCDPSTDPDRTDIANARAAIAANCDCAGAPSHG